jgi:hypothetical protein
MGEAQSTGFYKLSQGGLEVGISLHVIFPKNFRGLPPVEQEQTGRKSPAPHLHLSLFISTLTQEAKSLN